MISYKYLYSAANATEAYLIEGLLENAKIETILSGKDLSIGVAKLIGK